jgi:hypothetical protein
MSFEQIVLGLAGQGEELRWKVTPSHEYALAGLPGEIIAAGDAGVHAEALRLLAWEEPDAIQDVAYQTT